MVRKYPKPYFRVIALFPWIMKVYSWSGYENETDIEESIQNHVFKRK